MRKDWSLDISQLVIRGWQSGPEHGPIILASHGWLDSADSFVPIAEAAPDLRIIAFDWPGHGLSDHLSSDANYHFVDWVDVLYQIVLSLNSPVILLGHSLGALASSVYAGCFPEHVRGLVMIEGFGPISADPEESIGLMRKSLRSRAKLRNKNNTSYVNVEDAIKARMTASPDLTIESARLISERSLVSCEHGVQWRYDPRVKSFSPLRMSEAQARTYLKAIECPTLVVIGSSGYPELETILKMRAGLIHKLKLKELSGGHHVHMDDAKNLVEWMKLELF
ncbi:alpha/beta fold hydrolase [Echinimonas agarilytica]|uniref:Alpha/beta hydrolase n=1 Tax=Echinimonas agarilytica TaxID=1215918 RepID=A0AA42B724_9GAMM|nr:alpha/beta hydrolase [Echinimonas agarilytica]MCM2679432.1 alpha/beta hydrolase [Echinimonas agarilytica]